MHLKKLELVGFKSFLNKTTLHFEPGITAVVGPNGCGKSNIFDSIRWVLGEQSIKSLRGSQMEDVIFNGTDKKEALSMAEVNLTFDNSSRFFNLDNDEMVITRRVFRSGESEYLLNKSLVRLKDILDILMGTGVGAESYSLVAQGKIDLVLSSRPEDRRLVFDEAAGVTKYKSQKKEAMRKLEETEQNLLRVNDIVVEVKRQIGSLERQANKARRYKEVFEELKDKEIRQAAVQKKSLLDQKQEIIRQLSDLETREAAMLEVIKEQEERINNRRQEIRSLEERIMAVKNEMLQLENTVVRNKERIDFNLEKARELENNHPYLKAQLKQAQERLAKDEEKLRLVKEEFAGLEKNIEEKTALLTEKETQLGSLTESIKSSLEAISEAKKGILELAARISGIKNEITDLSAKQQVFNARQKRLELEKAKCHEERAVAEDSLNSVKAELVSLQGKIEALSAEILRNKEQLSSENQLIAEINSQAEKLERETLTLQSHKEFIEKLKSKYEGIGESMNAVIYLDRLPKDPLSGLVIKVSGSGGLSDEDKAYFEPAAHKLNGEAKPIDLDTEKIAQKIEKVQQELYYLENARVQKEARIRELNLAVSQLEHNLRSEDIAYANKKSAFDASSEQFNKIKEEEELIKIELNDVASELKTQQSKITELKVLQAQAEGENTDKEGLITRHQDNIVSFNTAKEEALVAIAKTKAEIDGLKKRLTSDASTLKMIEYTCISGRDNLSNIQRQIEDEAAKKLALENEAKALQGDIRRAEEEKNIKLKSLESLDAEYSRVCQGATDFIKKIGQDRNALDALKGKLYELQMNSKDIDFKFLSLKERLQQSYKLDLEILASEGEPQENTLLAQEIETLKQKLDAYGSVNLVAIEEYDELKKRYDFLMQQQADLNNAKESLHEAILKINRTTKKMFLETFERVREEFRNYFRLLFSGGDAQVFLIDEQDPLESGIEIICRPPGKKLQNVLLLSGGEKSLSAIALIFAIFKVKPSPFCILDEIDAALDEANVDRYSRLLQEFVQASQFIVITHNKRTIANANVMYGITMEESGVSKIVSVKFAQDKPKDKETRSADEAVAA